MDTRWKPNVTVAAVIERNGRFLLIEEHTGAGLRLNNPAGHLEAGESLEEAVVREVREEAAHVFQPTALIGIYLARYVRTGTTEDVTYLRITYAGTVGDPVPGAVLDDGIVRTLWLSREELAAQPDRLRSPLVLRGIDDWLAGHRHPLSLVVADASIYGPPGS